MKTHIILFRLLLLPQFALFLVELFREVRVFTYTIRFHRAYPIAEGSCLAETFTWQNALSAAVLSLALAAVIGLAGFRRWGRCAYLLFLGSFAALLPFLGPYDRKSAVVAGVLLSVFALTATLSFIHSYRADFTTNGR